jgi:site-specific recombinase XerD
VTEGYLSFLKDQGYSVSHRQRVKSVLNQFCQWLIDEKEALKRNPTRGIEIKAQQTLAPRVLSPDQRFVLRNLVEKADDLRGKAVFCTWLHVGFKGEKFRDIDLVNEARRPLYEYLQHGGRDNTSFYVFTSQRSSHLTEDGIHAWFRRLKHQANHEEWELVASLSFHDSDMILPIALVKLVGPSKK